jgi:hypothetical protein
MSPILKVLNELSCVIESAAEDYISEGKHALNNLCCHLESASPEYAISDREQIASELREALRHFRVNEKTIGSNILSSISRKLWMIADASTDISGHHGKEVSERKMKDGVREIIGKTIVSVVVAESARSPSTQMFLAFSDGTYFEIWGDTFTGAGGLDQGAAKDVIKYVESTGGKVTAAYTVNTPRVTREQAHRIATVDAQVHFLGNDIEEVVQVHELSNRRLPMLYGVNLMNCWIAYVDDESPAQRSSKIVLVDQITGEVVYRGFANDEG